MKTPSISLGADIGGTFTDVAMTLAGRLYSAKVLTDHGAPEQSILDAMSIVTKQAGIGFGDLGMIIHGTTLATNALIERNGARTALVTTEGFRDVIEMRTENRFDQYDLDIVLPTPLIARQDRFVVAGRMDAQGDELLALDENAIETLADTLRVGGFEAIAIGFIHSYQNPAHERRARDILAAKLPGVRISISAEVSPQMREFERFNTVCANAYVRPRMEAYLTRLQTRLKDMGATCPVFMIHSGGGLMSVETAIEFPVRLIESGPAGGAIFAADVAARFGLERVLSYDMGGTTAKICLIEGFTPQTARTFEVARTYRFAKGSGMPISIPVIEMIEIGAGGGSIASVDGLGRIQTGPESAGSDPGPACYGRGGERPAITDADVVLGKIDPDNFAGGAIRLDKGAAGAAIARGVGDALALGPLEAAFGICEVVDENMANAARVHAVENGKNIMDNVMIAFGGAAPLHAARLCEKLGIDRCLIPPGAGVGSAIGFLRAPFGYEALASRLVRLSGFDVDVVNAMLDGLRDSAEGFVRRGTSAALSRQIVAFMRYCGQGWEIPVPIPDRALVGADVDLIRGRFRDHYARFFGRAIDGLDGLEIEVVTWSVKVSEDRDLPARQALEVAGRVIPPAESRAIFDPVTNRMMQSSVVSRDTLSKGDRVVGPAVISERETATIVTSSFDAVMQGDGTVLLLRKGVSHERA